MTWYIIIGFIVGIGLGYLIFYLRYQHKDVVNELRSNLKEANKEVHKMTQELDEYTKQNDLLKYKMTEFLEKNDDLTKVVSELSKYYYHIQKASEKTEELSKFLQEPDVDIEAKMQVYLTEVEEKANEKTKEEKAFF